MSDDTENTPGDSGPEGGKLHEEDHHDDDDATDRSTAPQSDFTTRQAAIGALVTAIGVTVAYLLPGLLG